MPNRRQTVVWAVVVVVVVVVVVIVGGVRVDLQAWLQLFQRHVTLLIRYELD